MSALPAGSTVDPASLAEAGLVKGRFDGIVILGRGELEVALTVKAHRFSKTAASKIEAAGGTTEVVSMAPSKTEAADETTEVVTMAPSKTEAADETTEVAG